ncbi:hypothetical protein Tco_1285997 [Tanacetum coccineum]
MSRKRGLTLDMDNDTANSIKYRGMIDKIPLEENVANILTKPLEKDQFNFLILGLRLMLQEEGKGKDVIEECTLNNELILHKFTKWKMEESSKKLKRKSETMKGYEGDEMTMFEFILREYYYADHMNAILGVYTKLDEVTNLQCDYLEASKKCQSLENELSIQRQKVLRHFSNMLFNLELALQQCQEHIKNDKA